MADPSYIDSDGVLTDGEAWVGIAHASVSLPAATVTWTSTNDGQTGDFSQYMDLIIIAYAREANAADYGYLAVRFNNDTGANYPYQTLLGDGSNDSASTATSSHAWMGCVGDSAAANTFGASVFHMFDINSGKYKSSLNQWAGDDDGNGYVGIRAGTWNNQAAITEIDLTPWAGGNILAGSVFSLFGILPRMVA